MKHYYINKNAANHPVKRTEVHASWCPFMKSAGDKEYIGLFADARKAVSTAQKKGHEHVCGCPLCCPETHKGDYKSLSAL